MKKSILLGALILGLCSCGLNVEKEAQQIQGQLTQELSELLSNIGHLNVLQVRSQLATIEETYETNIENVKAQTDDPAEQDSLVALLPSSFSEVESYVSIVDTLAHRHQQTLDVIKDKKWISLETNGPQSIFYIDNKEVRAINSKTAFSYAVGSDGSLILDDSDAYTWYYMMEDSILILENSVGRQYKCREAQTDDLMYGEWSLAGTPKGNYMIIDFMNEQKAEIRTRSYSYYYGYQNNNATFDYTISNNTIKVDNVILKFNPTKLTLYSKDIGGTFYKKQTSALTSFSDLLLYYPATSSSSSSASSSSSSSSGSSDIDDMLDSYSKYVDKYISYYKKAMNGDMSALSEYPELLQQAQDFAEKLENVQGDMSTAQIQRYTKITMRMTEALQ